MLEKIRLWTKFRHFISEGWAQRCSPNLNILTVSFTSIKLHWKKVQRWSFLINKKYLYWFSAFVTLQYSKIENKKKRRMKCSRYLKFKVISKFSQVIKLDTVRRSLGRSKYTRNCKIKYGLNFSPHELKWRLLEFNGKDNLWC